MPLRGMSGRKSVSVALTFAKASNAAHVLAAKSPLSGFEPNVVRVRRRLVVRVFGFVSSAIRVHGPRQTVPLWRPAGKVAHPLRFRRVLRIAHGESMARTAAYPAEPTDEVKAAIEKRFLGRERLRAEDIADAIAYIVTRPRHVAINELLVRPTEQE